MQLTGKEIMEEGLVTNVVPEAIQQQGVDVRLMQVRRFGHYDHDGKFVKNTLIDHAGVIPAHGKTKLPDSEEIQPQNIGHFKDDEIIGWKLEPGYYEVIFDEGCKMPNNRVMVLISRSSLVRCGAFIECGQFDAGFNTEHMGCFMYVAETIYIEQHARIAQLRFTTTAPVESEDMYNGQWQNDKQRDEQK